jgi:hypothetical protein
MKSRTRKIFNHSRKRKQYSFKKIIKEVKIIENANFDVFQLLSLEQKKLQIIYANIRV